MTTASSLRRPQSPRSVARWPTERPLFVMCVLWSVTVWVLLTVSVVGILYAAVFALFFLFAHAAFVAHVRGNGVRLSPEQFPDLHEAVEGLANQLGLKRVPEAYLMQAGGTLNAFASKFLRSDFIVLFTDLLEACEGNPAARDMIIAHELGHLKAGHLEWRWLIAPALLFPFLGTALSRAREYTCDRYGLAGAGDLDGAIHGLTVLAAGGKHASRVNQQAFLEQREALNRGWMAIGEWLSTHPPLSKRVAQLLPPTHRPHVSAAAGNVRGALILGLIASVVGAVTVAALAFGSAFLAQIAQQPGQAEYAPAGIDVEASTIQVQQDFDRLAGLLEASAGAGTLPQTWDAVEELWSEAYPSEPLPYDPFDGARYGYMLEDGGFVLWSSGPDGVPGTDDDIVRRSGVAVLIPN